MSRYFQASAPSRAGCAIPDARPQPAPAWCTPSGPAAGKRARVQTLYRTDKLEPLGEALAVLQFARSQVGRVAPAGTPQRQGPGSRGRAARRGDSADGLLPTCPSLVQAAKQARNLTHPLLCLDAIQYGVEHGGRAGLQKVRP